MRHLELSGTRNGWLRRLVPALALVWAACGGGEAPRDRGNEAQGEAMAGMSGMGGTSGTGGMSGMDAANGSSPDPAPIRVSARQAALAGVTYSVAREAPLDRTVRAVAMVVPNERGLATVNARVAGWVERLDVKETGRYVEAGEPLLELYAPDLVTAQEELLLALRLDSLPEGERLAEAARRQLGLWEISDDQIAELERTGEVRRTLTIRSRHRGHVLERHVIEGQMVRPGEPLLDIADLSTVWVEPAIFETDIPLVRVGQRAQVTFDALPGHLFEGRVTFIYPQLDMKTRTLRVRVEVPNPGFRIKPMMYGAVRINADGPRGVVVPLAAVLPTGQRDLAFVLREGGVVPTEVVVGARGDSTVLVADGLAPGDTVVSSATFLFDSESQLAAAMAGIMLNMGMGLDMGGMQMEEMEEMEEMEGTELPGMRKGPAESDSMPGMRMDTPQRKERRP